MYGVILCSGKGRKIWPFNDWWQKCCIPIVNKPIVVRLVEQLERLNLEGIYVVTGYNSEMVKYFLKDKTNITIIEENQSEGTAKSLLKGLKQIKGQDYIVVFGDTVVDEDSIKAVIDAYKKNKIPTALTQNLKKDERSIDWICAKVQDDEIKNIYGHPRSHYVNTRLSGVFVLNNEVVKYLETNPGYMKNVCVGGMPPKESDLLQSLQMMIEDSKKILNVEVQNYCIDVDKPWNILEANKVVIDDLFSLMKENDIHKTAYIDETAVIDGKVRLGKGSRIGKNVIIKGDIYIGDNTIIDYGPIIEGNVVIGNNTMIKDTCNIKEYTTIGNNNKIGFNAEMSGITFDNVSIAHNSEINGIIGSYTDIAAGCITGSLRFDDTETPNVINGRVEIPSDFSDAICIGDHSRTGVGNIFFPGVKVGVNSVLWPGAIINREVLSNTLVIIEQNRIDKKWGPEKYGW
ncbi:sugar phosphate nucleotidyltransferase [Abyssisolibacter fermentans]|uniref:sugar phosphate nucleotidyltransferase n=1 Tax=Abyssisolibacter fermentans TaxID=1766203 RepID=UPI000832CEE9|nr:sugar phosphate nucleotidyltransferase [Abyssisolibacter fermentans]